MPFSFIVNGTLANIDAAPDTPLLWVVREHLKLTGTKYGCGAGMCGACTVHLDGQAVRSCQTPIAAVTGKRVTTIEGLSADGDHPLQKAWVELQVPQRGYCQSGQITGVIRVHRLWVVLDPGIVVNPDSVLAQVEGSAIFGISGALKEQVSISAGQVQQNNFYDYPVLRMSEVPDVDIQIIATDNPPGGGG